MIKAIFIVIIGTLFLSWGFFDLDFINSAFNSVIGMLNTDIIYYFSQIWLKFISYFYLMQIVYFIVILYIVGLVIDYIMGGRPSHVVSSIKNSSSSSLSFSRPDSLRRRKKAEYKELNKRSINVSHTNNEYRKMLERGFKNNSKSQNINLQNTKEVYHAYYD